MSRKGALKTGKSDADNIAKSCDMRQLRDVRAVRVHRERLKYLFASGKKPRDPGPTPSMEEQTFWKEKFRQNPFLLVRNGAFLIKAKEKGFVRFEPNGEQLDIIDFCEECWLQGIIPQPMILKCRQDGMSTLAEIIMLALEVALGECYTHVVANKDFTCLKMLKIQRNAILGLPLWMRPNPANMRDNDKGLEIDDEASGIVGVQVQTGSANLGEDIGLGDPAQFRHYTEIEIWKKPADVFGALEAAEVWSFPAIHIQETTGRNEGSPYYNSWFELWNAQHSSDKSVRDAITPGCKAFFFAWYRHANYRTKLTRPEEVFWADMDDAMHDTFKLHGCDAEQANWYMIKYNKALSKRTPIEKLRREFPFTPEEAFIGGSYSVFDKEKIKMMGHRAATMKKVKLKELRKTSAPNKILDGWKPFFSQAELIWNTDGSKPAHFHDSMVGGWYIWEVPRKGHWYTVSCDIAEGKDNDADDQDYSVTDVWRWSYDDRIDAPCITQVAQFRSQKSVPDDQAHGAFAVSTLYKNADGENAQIIFERNNNGRLFQETVKLYEGWNLHRHYNTDKDGRTFVEFGIQVTTGGLNVQRAKNTLVGYLRSAIKQDMMWANSRDTVAEYGHFIKDDDGAYHARGDEHDDTVSTSYLAIENIRVANNGIIEPIPVVADGAFNIVEQPEQSEINEARSIALFEKHIKDFQSAESSMSGQQLLREGFKCGV